MKIAGQPRFWSLRPTLTAGGLELSCWLAAGLLAVVLVISSSPPAEPPAQAVGAIAVQPAPELLILRQQCIDRVLASGIGMTEEYVVRQINRQCMARRRTAARSVGLTCIRPLVAQFSPVARWVAGCFSG